MKSYIFPWLINQYPDPVVNEGCQEFEVNNTIISNFVLQNLVPIVGVKPYPLNELMLMTASFNRLKPSKVFEWGTNIGKSARIFYEIARGFRIKTEIYSIDLPDSVYHGEHPGKLRGKYVKKISDVHLYQGDGLMKSLAIYNQFTEHYRTLFFLDGDHNYTSILRELRGIIKNTQNAGILVHDTFYQSRKSNYNIGPYKAVNKILSEYPGIFKIITTGMGLPGMVFLLPHKLK